jgi:hypothetical protein
MNNNVLLPFEPCILFYIDDYGNKKYFEKHIATDTCLKLLFTTNVAYARVFQNKKRAQVMMYELCIMPDELIIGKARR